MHVVCNLKDIMLDYDSVHGYWCFSFERYNGMLETMHKSWVNPEKQLLSEFIDLQLVNTVDISAGSKSDFISLVLRDVAILKNMSAARSSGSVHLMAYESIDLIQQLTSRSGPTHVIDPEEKDYHGIIKPLYEKCLTDQDVSHVYEAVYPNNRIIHVARFCKEFKKLISYQWGRIYIREVTIP